ncbi:MAG: FecR domain-containing protein [Tannerella sp.]|jgi:ferric-dicitrate binding protein FerR (iron transport regulator)|nr:FecR domain-containing protein [Tannerella sp.]
MDKDILYRFFDRQASAEDKAAIKQWLEESPANQEEFYRERQFFGAMIMNSGVPENQIQKEQERGLTRTPGYRKIVRELVKIAAIVLLTATGVLYFMYNKAEEGRESWLSVIVPAGQRANVLLPDGTNVWLNARTQLRYPGVFASKKREIELNGEAYFEVSQDKGKPFIVHTDKCEIEVLGTKFNVDAYSDSEDFFAALMEGSVRVTDRSEKTNTLILQPDYLTTFRNGILVAEKITDYDYFRWRDGLVCFREMGFVQLMHRFEKCYGIQIEINNPRLSEYAFTGKFRISDGIDNALRVLQRDAPYTFKRNEDDNVIYIE